MSGRLRTGERSIRVLRFMSGMRNPRIANKLARFGFTQRDLDRGWELLRVAVNPRLAQRNEPLVDPRALDELDGWENLWFPVARATLRYAHPKVGEEVFRNLIQTAGLEVILSVSTFIERFDALAEGDEEEQAAHALLISRGLDDATVGRARQLLARLQSVRPTPVVDPAELRLRQEEGDEALWAWYLQWSAIARVAVRSRGLLRELGFLARSGSSPGSGGEADDEELLDPGELEEGEDGELEDEDLVGDPS